MSYKILITGGSSGIGKATALEFLKSGHHVMAAARRSQKLEELKNEAGADAERLHLATLDVTSQKSVDAFLQSNKEYLASLDVLVNNAGLALGREHFQDADLADIETVISTNVMGLLRLTRALVPTMIKKRFGHVVNLGSIAGIQSYPSGTVYCATKAAVHMITNCLRLDLVGTGVRVSTIAPGRVAETEFSAVRYKGDMEKAKSVYEGFRVMTAQDVARTIAWVVNQPPHINIQEVVLMSTDQPDARSVMKVKG